MNPFYSKQNRFSVTRKAKYFGAAKVLSYFLLMSAFFVSSGQAAARHPKTFPIHLSVDFGPVEKQGFDDTLLIEKGTTPREAVAQVFPVLLGKACCSLREIIEIGGVGIDPMKNRWWTVAVNGSKKVSPQKKKLKRGDHLEWVYVEESQ